MPSVPTQFKVTCDHCGMEVTSDDPVPHDWAVVPKPSNRGNPQVADRGFLCPGCIVLYNDFWIVPTPPTLP